MGGLRFGQRLFAILFQIGAAFADFRGFRRVRPLMDMRRGPPDFKPDPGRAATQAAPGRTVPRRESRRKSRESSRFRVSGRE
jgi:hypothetical protein